jgi:hypothetical protein
MILHFNPFGARRGTWNKIRLSEADDWALYCAGRCNPFGTCMAARGTEAEIDDLIASQCLV